MVKLSFQSSLAAILSALKCTDNFFPSTEWYSGSQFLAGIEDSRVQKERGRLCVGNEDLKNLFNHAEYHLCFTQGTQAFHRLSGSALHVCQPNSKAVPVLGDNWGRPVCCLPLNHTLPSSGFPATAVCSASQNMMVLFLCWGNLCRSLPVNSGKVLRQTAV